MTKCEIENPTYFLCNKKDVHRLVTKAKYEAEKILEELKAFYTISGVLDIEIEPIECFAGWYISGKLTWDGETVIEEKDCGLLFCSLTN